MSKVAFCKLTKAQYDAITAPDSDTIYFLTDTKAIFLGGDEYTHTLQGLNVVVSETAPENPTEGTIWITE